VKRSAVAVRRLKVKDTRGETVSCGS